MQVTRRITSFLSHSQAEFDLQKDLRDAWIFVAILVFEERRWQIFAWVQSDSTIDFPGRFQVFPATVALDGWNVSRTVDNAHFRLRGENARELAHRGRISSLLVPFIDEYSSNKPRFSTPWIASNFRRCWKIQIISNHGSWFLTIGRLINRDWPWDRDVARWLCIGVVKMIPTSV